MAALRKRRDDEPFIFPHQMTAEEREALKAGGTPDSILRRIQEGKGVTTTTMAFKKVAAQMRAEAEMYEETLRADRAKREFAKELDLTKTVVVQQEELAKMEKEIKRLNTRLGQATATRALAEPSEGTR
jgi:hypothetical protein